VLYGILSLAGAAVLLLLGWTGVGDALRITGVSASGDLAIRFLFPLAFVILGAFLLLPLPRR
jgi:hypothetical protein